VVRSHEVERSAVRDRLASVVADRNALRVTVLTTLQCNFACGYCVQGDHGGPRSPAGRMSSDTAERTADWITARLDELKPSSFVLTFFGGEPLLNLAVVEYLAERAWTACRARQVWMRIHLITNGLLLTAAIVDRLLPFGLAGVKVTLDGSREVHDRQRPLRGGQGTFDRIVENVRQVAPRVPVAIGGNFDGTDEGFSELLDFLAKQPFARHLDKVSFKPVIGRDSRPPARVIPITPVPAGSHDRGTAARDESAAHPCGGHRHARAPIAGAARAPHSLCDSCGLADDLMIRLAEQTKAHGFQTSDAVHMGPCEFHLQHAYTVAPDGSLHACPGFAADPMLATGHVAGDHPAHARAAQWFARVSPWRDACGDCAFVPVCGGGCTVAAHSEAGDLSAPSCHKPVFEAAVATLAREAVSHVSKGDSQ
jgi:uncharacterized protein